MAYILNNTKRLNILLTALLDYSTVSYQSASIETVPLGEVLEEVTNHLADAIQAKQAIIEYEKPLPMLQINRLHLFKLLESLLTNALKFNTRIPHIQLSVETNADELLIAVQDNGIGIDAAYTGKIFKLFQQLEKTHQSQDTSVGVGLSICKNIVEKYGGKIWFESELQVGTTFFIALPLALK